MNTTELKQDLDSLVRDVTTDRGFAAGVASKVRARGRARTAGVGVACAALLTLGAGLTSQLGSGTHTPTPATSGHAAVQPTPTMTGTDGMPTRSLPAAPRDVVKDGLRIRAQIGGDSLAAGFISDVGQGQATMLWDVTTNHVAIGAECYLPSGAAEQAKQVELRVRLVGSEGFVSQGACSTAPPAGHELVPGWTPGEPGHGWTELTVGKPAGLRVQLVDAKSGAPVAVATARFALAVYNQGPQRVVPDPRTGQALAALPETVEHEGYRYRLVDLVAGAPSRKQPAVATPAGAPFLITYGSAGTPVGSTEGWSAEGGGHTVRLTGLGTDPGAMTGGGWTTAAQPARAAGTVQLVRDGAVPDTGVDFVAIYTLEE